MNTDNEKIKTIINSLRKYNYEFYCYTLKDLKDDEFPIFWKLVDKKIKDSLLKNTPYILCQNYKEYFKLWFNKEKINYRRCHLSLIKYCSDYFNIWWDINKIIFEDSFIDYIIKHLILYANNYFDIWYNDFVEKYKNNFNILREFYKTLYENQSKIPLKNWVDDKHYKRYKIYKNLKKEE